MMDKIIPEKKKRSRWLWLAGALFLFVVPAVTAWNRIHANHSVDPLTATERAWLRTHPVIRLAPDPNFPPVEFVDDSGVYSGITADYVALIEKNLGIRIEIVRLQSWNDIIAKAKNRQIDVYVATQTPQRAEYMLFTKPFLKFPVVIIAREKLKAPLNMDKLSGMNVSVVSEYAAHNIIALNYPEIHLDLISDVRTGLQKVSFGLSDVFVENLATASYYIEREGITNLRIAGESGFFYRMGFCSRKDWPELNSILEKGLAGISAGEKKAIYKKWIPVEPRSLFSSKKFQAALLAAFTAILAVVSGVIAWNRTLSRQVRLRTVELENELAERKRMEEELERARDQLEYRVEERTAELAKTVQSLRFTQFAVDRSLDQAFWMTNDGHFFYVNDAACDSLGYTRDELVTMSVPDIDPACPPEMVVHYWRVLRENGTDTFETCHRAKDGRVYPVEIRSNLLIFDGKEYNCCFVTDITERKRAEELLRKSEMTQRELASQLARKNNFLRTLMDAIPDLIFYKDCNRAYLGCNKAFEAFAGRQEKDLIGCTHLDIFSKDIADSFREMYLAIVSTEESRRNEEWIVYPDGRRVLLETLKTPFFGPDGEILGIVGVSRDITEQKRAIAELELTQFLVDKAAIGIQRISDEGNILYANEYTCRTLGYTAKEICLLTVFDIDPTFNLEKFLEHRKSTRDSGSRTFESIHRRKDGSTFPVEITVNYLQSQDKELDFNVSFAKDITERKQSEEALRESEERVRRKLDSILDPEGDTVELDLADILDAPQIQALMDDLYRINGLKMSIIDLKGQVLADVGWQTICSKFHRMHPETLKKCHESDTALTVGVPQGEFKTYKCKNNMWHIVTPIIVGGRHMGNLFMGQFFFSGEQIDNDLFRSQAKTYGFPEEEYMAALDAVPRHGEVLVNLGKAVFLRLTDMFSKLSFANIKLAHSLAERDRLTATLQQANLVVENSPVVLFRWRSVDEWPVELVSGNIIQFGYTPDDFLSGSITYSAIIHPDDLQRVTREVHDLCNGGADQFRLEYRIMAKGGDIRWVNKHTHVEWDAAGGVKSFEGVVIDVTERKIFEEELTRQKSLLEKLNETLENRVEEEVRNNREKDIMLIQQNRQAALGEMLDHIAHQWKQPLNSVSLIAQEMAYRSSDGELTDERVQTTIGKIISLLEHMAHTVDVFRGFYRPDKEAKVFSIKDSIDQAIAFIAPAFTFQSIAVELDVDPGLTGFGYPKEYAQALLNILANARDVFRIRKTGEPRVILRGFAESGKSVVTIRDNAGGIPEAVKDRIFDFYFTTNEAAGGTGIGLYMSKNIIEKNMDGTLSAENMDGGAQFRIEISPT